MASITDVAALAGVSAATVSRALSGNGHVSAATRGKVVEAAETLGYVASSSASSLASGRTRNVGVVVPFVDRWYFSAVIEGAQRALMERGYDLTLYTLREDGAARASVFEQFLLRKRVDAVIAVSLELTEAEVQRLHALHKPLVGIGGPLTGVRTLTIDNPAVARLCTEHLLALGHTRIAFAGGSLDEDGAFDLNLSRRQGFAQAMHGAGIDVPDEDYRSAEYSIDTGYVAAKQLLGRPHGRPTAIVAGSDEVAIGCILAAKDLGMSVPRDVSITGIDDHELAAFFDLTTVAQFPQRQGALAVELLMDDLHPDAADADAAPRSTALPFELVVRGSTARPAP
ncbi:LacI family transcriptional regulator [Sediminihabitans luteus]|uniref:LacI family transcriptional regulator n=1 Tax=Sediminihabitans luteus TaxID=1138585 RepID=A0A2M9D1N3_9CELL|nr:LacI family DNA-binding transcriptional regulator [Sediminihabitans luteus]PJJ77908.1 LacI family transcriptional regulator [Sediminihabitans luteus]GII99735.1 LacI family transcriptional regulator [Sediminihabitans luteus]